MSGFDGFLDDPAARHATSRAARVSKTNPYSRDDEPYLSLLESEQFDAVDSRDWEPGTYRVEEIARVRGELKGFGRRVLADGRSLAQRRTLGILLADSEVPAHLLERLDR